ncbi:MAG: hypothetical protein HY885_07350 [Deltaproteobacteria bacterium]|nr:hypothetical protein [Deltaproteobacteria bacterium]
MGLLGSIMDIGHTVRPIFSGLVASFFGYILSFVGAAMILAVISLFFFISIGMNEKRT